MSPEKDTITLAELVRQGRIRKLLPTSVREPEYAPLDPIDQKVLGESGNRIHIAPTDIDLFLFNGNGLYVDGHDPDRHLLAVTNDRGDLSVRNGCEVVISLPESPLGPRREYVIHASGGGPYWQHGMTVTFHPDS